MGILTWVIVGLVLGLLGNVVLKHPARDALADFLLGAVGAVAGGLIASVVLKMPDALDALNLVATLFAVVGAVAVFVISAALRVRQPVL
jgi:uncharacterized membrane protein YeaQ/YmgE (transglycosylase-associated protein family)